MSSARVGAAADHVALALLDHARLRADEVELLLEDVHLLGELANQTLALLGGLLVLALADLLDLLEARVHRLEVRVHASTNARRGLARKSSNRQNGCLGVAGAGPVYVRVLVYVVG